MFTTAVILHALRSVKDDPGVQGAAHKAIQWLKNQRDQSGLWIFFGKAVRDFPPEEQIPPDIDCNAYIASAFRDWNADFPYGMFIRELAKYQNQDGLFGTWMYGGDFDWHPSVAAFVERYEVDPVANANTAYLFYQHGMVLPGVEPYLENQIVSGQFHRPSHYYFSPAILIYVLSKLVSFHPRLMEEGRGKTCREALLAVITETDSSKVTPLEKAMAVSAALKGSIPIPRAQLDCVLAGLQELQSEDGGWDPCPFYGTYFAHYGSRGLTTAFIVEAMALRERLP